MWRRLPAGEQGQSLIQFAVIIVMLLVFVSLAIDVGSVYAERRKMQNAADAAALAGARELCLGHSHQHSTIQRTRLPAKERGARRRRRQAPGSCSGQQGVDDCV